MTVCIVCHHSLEKTGELQVKPDLDSDPLAAAGKSLSTLHYKRCGVCGSISAVDSRRDPVWLRQAYAHMSEEYWSGLGTPARLVEAIASRLDGIAGTPEVWDVGCGDGALLKLLPGRWSLHGIEPGLKAVERARASGLDVRAGSASELKLQSVADAVLCVDVIEHLSNPRLELAAMYEMLKPGGKLIIVTGDSDSLHARLSGNKWYYLMCFGHIAVHSWRALEKSLNQTGFKHCRIERFSHDASISRLQWWRQLIMNQSLGKLLERYSHPMYYRKDHMIAMAER